MGDLASVDDLATLMKRTFTGDDLAQATLVVQIVSSWTRAVSGQLWPDAPTGVPPDVVGVVLTASRRELNNPDRVITETMGPFNVTFDTPPAGFFSAGELAILHRFRPQSNAGGIRTISSSRGERGVRFAGQVRLGVNGAPWTIFDGGDLGWYWIDDGWGDGWDERDCWR